MDGGGRLDQSLMRSGPKGADQSGTPFDEPSLTHAHTDPDDAAPGRFTWFFAYSRKAARFAERLPRGFGAASTVLIIGGALAYGAVRGEHVPAVIDWFKEARDVAANAAGFRIAAISLSGQKE